MRLEDFTFALPIVWIAGWIAGSAIYRKHRGKPLIPRPPANAAFAESWRSGRSLDNWLTALGGARNCLLIYVADGGLTIVPNFPFNLMFLPEFYRLEATAPVAKVVIDEVNDGLFRRSVKLSIRDGKPHRFEIWLQDPQRFRQALHGMSSAAGDVAGPARARLSWRLTAFSLFALAWGLLASIAGWSGLNDDLRFHRDGVAVTATMTGHTGQAGDRNDSGLLSYEVGGRTYSLASLRGSGVYKIGDHEVVRYLPADPGMAREDDELAFSLFWVGLGGLFAILGLALNPLLRIALHFARGQFAKLPRRIT